MSSDTIDDANDYAERLARHGIEAQREAAAAIPPGVPGDCEQRGEWSGRLVQGVCAPCLDRYRLP